MKEPASVLVVDDNADLVDTFSLILKRKGYQVDTAEDGLSAVEKFRKRPFDVTLMDIIMPNMNGVEAFRKIREINPGARVILMTAYYEEEEIKTAVDEGAYSAVHKPVNIAQLIELIGKATLNSPILIVDDDDDFRRTMARSLELNGYRVDAAGSGEEAVRIVKERPCHIALVDVKMPVMDGLETYLKLKEINSGMVTIMMTGYREEVDDIVGKALAANAATCLYKPFDLSRVMDLVRQISGDGSKDG
ncbi:response regulator [Chloroflexota bacterium]